MGLLDIDLEPTRTPISMAYMNNKGWFMTRLYQMPIVYLCMTCWKLSKVVKLQDGVSEETINADLSFQYKICTGGTKRLYLDLHVFSYKAGMDLTGDPSAERYWMDEIRFFEQQVQRIFDELQPMLDEPIETTERLELISDGLYAMLTQSNISIHKIEDDRAAARNDSELNGLTISRWV